MKEYLINGKTFRLAVFDKIEDKEQAYLLGYLLGDGGIQGSTHKRLARLYVCSSNEEIITYFRDRFTPDAAINKKWPINKTRDIVANKYAYSLGFSSKFSESFNKFGLLSTKSNRDIVNIPKKFMKSYLLGLFDADGHFSWGRRKDRNRLWVNMAITHQSLKALTKIQKYLYEELGMPSYVSPRNDEECLDLKMSKREDVVRFIEWLYEDTPESFDKNKRNKGYAFISEYKSTFN